MSPSNALVEVTVSLRVRHLLEVIDQRFGSIDKLRKRVEKDPNDSGLMLLLTSAERHADDPDLLLHLGEHVLGQPADLLAATKLEILSILMGRPGIGIRELARVLEKNPATILEQVTHLEAQGLLRKEDHGPGKAVALHPLVEGITIRVTARSGAEA